MVRVCNGCEGFVKWQRGVWGCGGGGRGGRGGVGGEMGWGESREWATGEADRRSPLSLTSPDILNARQPNHGAQSMISPPPTAVNCNNYAGLHFESYISAHILT